MQPTVEVTVTNTTGSAATLSGSRAIVGAHRDDDNGSMSGSAYIFEDTGSGWTQVAKLTAADGTTYDWFGWSVSISGDRAIVGAYGNDDAAAISGSAYVFAQAGNLDLLAASDSGVSNGDNITNDNAPTFAAIGSPYFRLYRDGTTISGDDESGSSYTAASQADGTYDYTVKSVDEAGNESVEWADACPLGARDPILAQ